MHLIRSKRSFDFLQTSALNGYLAAAVKKVWNVQEMLGEQEVADPERSGIFGKPTPMPNAAQRNAVVTVIVSVIWGDIAMILMIRLIIPDNRAQVHLQLKIVAVSLHMAIYTDEAIKFRGNVGRLHTAM